MTAVPGRTAQMSLIGSRKINQYRCLLVEDEACVLLALADGMGGHPMGEMASQIMTETCASYFQLNPHPIRKAGTFLTRMLHKAHENIVAFGYDQSPPVEPRTTAVAVLVQDGIAYTAHVGDSRFYLLRDSGVVSRTVDHSYVEKLKQQGIISPREQKFHPQRNFVTRCLGGSMEPPEITLGKHDLDAGDILLLCSDGIWGSISDRLLIEMLFDSRSLKTAVDILAEEAVRRAPTDSDNATLIALRMSPAEAVRENQDDRRYIGSAEEAEIADAIAELNSAIDRFDDGD
jgi:serine/threonine protein phosphatase PrpC